MLDKNTFRTHPSLLPLRMALLLAESESPARPPQSSADEQRAMDLIEKMKTEYSKPLPFTSWKDDSILSSFRLQEVIGSHA
ncbi:MAG: hypothetical protein IPP66_06305 [Anaerolineales bacterium]|nr:hypothetical protein [Anaerolineales bacterium]